MSAGTATVKLPKDLYARLETLAQQVRTDPVELLNLLATSAATQREQDQQSLFTPRPAAERAQTTRKIPAAMSSRLPVAVDLLTR
jgi:hypothetical protein